MDGRAKKPLAGAVLVALVLVGGGYLLTRGDDDPTPDTETSETSETSETTSTTVYPGDPTLHDPGSGGTTPVPPGDTDIVIVPSSDPVVEEGD